MRFIDANVLLYSVGAAPAELGKRSRAIELLRSRDLALSVQVPQECYVQAIRPERVDPISPLLARVISERWTRYPIQLMTMAIVTKALDIKARHGFSYWDCAIIAAAQAFDCHTLLTEDLSHGQIVEGLTTVNPFL